MSIGLSQGKPGVKIPGFFIGKIHDFNFNQLTDIKMFDEIANAMLGLVLDGLLHDNSQVSIVKIPENVLDVGLH